MATPYQVVPYPWTQVPLPAERHVMRRLGCGYSTQTLAHIRASGGLQNWLNRQLNPYATVPESSMITTVNSWFPQLWDAPLTRVAHNANGSRSAWIYGRDLGTWTMLRRMYSQRQVLETMVDFWSNHFHISVDHERAWVHRMLYDGVIRQHALGRFDQMLQAVSTHPSMSLWLDNWRSTRNAPNENQGRELLELHTVTAAAGFTEDMVKDSAVLLSGYSVDFGGSYQPFYDAKNHTVRPVRVLDFTHANGSSDGRSATAAYLSYLAHHPATAHNIATKLAIRFVSDTPSVGLVNHLASTFLSSGTDIRATMRALLNHPEFWSSANQKVMTPVDDMVATARALGAVARAPHWDKSFARAIASSHGGQRLYTWPRPDGSPERNADWISAARMLASFRMHYNMSAGAYPKLDVTYRAPVTRIPRAKMPFSQYFDNLSRTLLGKPATPTTLYQACVATGLGPRTTISRKHALASWMFPYAAAVLLDSPDHMKR